MIAAIGNLPAEAFGAVKRSIGSYVRRSRVFMIGPGTTNVIGSSGFTGTVLFVCKEILIEVPSRPLLGEALWCTE